MLSGNRQSGRSRAGPESDTQIVFWEYLVSLKLHSQAKGEADQVRMLWADWANSNLNYGCRAMACKGFSFKCLSAFCLHAHAFHISWRQVRHAV